MRWRILLNLVYKYTLLSFKNGSNIVHGAEQ